MLACLPGFNSLICGFAIKKDEYDKEHNSRVILCKQQQGVERNQPSWAGLQSTGKCAVQLPAKYCKGTLGRKGPWQK